jgi:hypothetical protein
MLVNVVRTTEERLASESAAQHLSLTARLAEVRSTHPAESVPPVENRLAMKITCNNNEQITNAGLISNGKSRETLSLRPDSFARTEQPMNT